MTLSRLWLWRWDRYTRYSPVIKYLKDTYGSGNLSILEVGSGDYSLSLYDGYVVDGLDLTKPANVCAVRKFYNESILETTLKSDTYDIVVCVDTLEHILSDLRVNALRKMLSICKKELILVYPSGQNAIDSDFELYEFYKRHIGKNHRWFMEHKELGVPTENDLEKYLLDLKVVGKNFTVQKLFLTDLNKLRIYAKFMMSKSYFRFLIKNKLVFLFDYFFGSLIKSNKYYRRFVIISIK